MAEFNDLYELVQVEPLTSLKGKTFKGVTYDAASGVDHILFMTDDDECYVLGNPSAIVDTCKITKLEGSLHYLTGKLLEVEVTEENLPGIDGFYVTVVDHKLITANECVTIQWRVWNELEQPMIDIHLFRATLKPQYEQNEPTLVERLTTICTTGTVVPFETLIGKTLKSFEMDRTWGMEHVSFKTEDDEQFILCAKWSRKSVVMIISDEADDETLALLLDGPITVANEKSQVEKGRDGDTRLYRYSFYELGTINTTVTIRWEHGDFSGSDLDGVQLYKIAPPD